MEGGIRSTTTSTPREEEEEEEDDLSLTTSGHCAIRDDTTRPIISV